MTAAAVCISHSPLVGLVSPGDEAENAVEVARASAREFVADYAPDLAVIFAPDHFHAFRYDAMPQFCVGLEAHAMGDFDSIAGTLAVPGELAEDAARALLEADVDVALSADMTVDHGFAQPLETLFGSLDKCPTVPVFINCAAGPLAPLRRSRHVGSTLGRWAAGLEERVLFIGSGGLSHDVPVPASIRSVPERDRPRLVDGVGTEARLARESGLVGLGAQYASGTLDMMRPLDPVFDEAFLDLIAAGDLETIAGWENDHVAASGGATHEIRAWLAAFSALEVTGPFEVHQRFYRPIPHWIVAFGLMTAMTR